MPLRRRHSSGQVEDSSQHLEGIAETAETLEEEELRQEITCSAPKSRFMHKDCFETWQETLLNVLTSSKEAQKKVRNWSEKQKVQHLWKQGYSLVSGHCGCRCGEGTLRKDLNWVPLRSSSSGNSAPNSDSEKQKRRRKKGSKSSKPALTIGLPTFVNGLQIVKRSDIQGIPSNRQRTNSMSSSNSGSSSWGSPATSPPQESKLPPRQVNMRDRSRHDSGGSIFFRRNDYSAFNVLPKQKINSYHIKMEDECSIGNDETRCFILSSYATHKMNKVPCVLCNNQMIIFERYPLIDGTFFISPKQHTSASIQVKSEGRLSYLSAICMGCLEGWTARLQCRSSSCSKCNSCGHLVIHPDQRINFFSDYSQTVSCPQCGVQDFHFVKPLKHSFLTKEDVNRGLSSGDSGISGLTSQLSWARITANC